ncbi:tetratricopeptide repeat protein [Neomegalonema sp.]|uniref:tetratricopeptide repeat protein n=1 Tax=Neomegalonema sp. TaxID=2039713 RepID=UPI002622FB7F|nr:tetratricopeptide repeat protein [Neomegalonema sp.]MDD2869133.1 tetratricopeptide repeat protein [Neomegalonema sp.]
MRKAGMGAEAFRVAAVLAALAAGGAAAQEASPLPEPAPALSAAAEAQMAAESRLGAEIDLEAALRAMDAGRLAEAAGFFDMALAKIGGRASAQDEGLRGRAVFGRALALASLDRAAGRGPRESRALAQLPPRSPEMEETAETALARAAVHLALGSSTLEEAQMALDAASARGLRADGWRLEMLRGEIAYRLAGYEAALTHFKAAGQAGAPGGAAEQAVGDALMALRRWPEAEEAYRLAAEARPQDPEALLRRIRAREAQRRPAGRDFDPLAAMDLAGARGASGYAFLAERGALRRAAGLTKEALEDLREAVDLAPQEKKAMARYAYGAALGDARRWQEADQVFQSIENQPEMRALLDFQRGRMMLDAGQPARALTLFERVLELRPGDPSALYNRGVTRLRMGQLSAAEADFAAAAARDPTAPDLRDALGRMKFQSSVMQGAAFYDAAVLAHPNDPESWTQRAGLLLAMGQPASAAQDAASALRLAERHPQATLYMAEAQLALGDVAAAYDYAEQLRRSPTQAGPAALVRARARLAQDQANAAMRELDAAEVAGAPLDQIALARGEAALAMGLSDHEIGGYYDQAVSLSGGAAAALSGRARFLASRGMTSGALADLTQALNIAPNDPTLLARRGELLRLLGECARAQEDLDRAFEMGLKDSEARRARAACRAKDGRIFGAIGDFFRAMF